MMLNRMCQGTAEAQHRELQTARGMFKQQPCNHEHSRNGCRAGAMCLVAHDTDDPEMIDAEVSEIRYRIFSRLSEMKFALPPEVRWEIGEVAGGYDHDAEETYRRIGRPEPKLMPRPRTHNNSRPPKGSPRRSLTPERASGKGIGGKSSDKGAAMDPDDGPRLRDHTMGEESSPSHEVADHIEYNADDILPEEETACDYDVETEPFQPPANESSDAAMEDDIPTIHA